MLGLFWVELSGEELSLCDRSMEGLATVGGGAGRFFRIC